MTQTLDHVVVVHILIWDKRKSQINEYSDLGFFCIAQGSKWCNKALQTDEFMELVRCTKISCRYGGEESGGSMAQKPNHLLNIKKPSLSLPEALIICQEDQQVRTGSWNGWCHAKDPKLHSSKHDMEGCHIIEVTWIIDVTWGSFMLSWTHRWWWARLHSYMLGVVYTMDHKVVPRRSKNLWLVVELIPRPLQLTPRKHVRLTVKFQVSKRHDILRLSTLSTDMVQRLLQWERQNMCSGRKR